MKFFDNARVFKTYLYLSARFWRLTSSKFDITLFSPIKLSEILVLLLLKNSIICCPFIASSLFLS